MDKEHLQGGSPGNRRLEEERDCGAGQEDHRPRPGTGKCIQFKPDGSRCRANARTGRDYCFTHDPESAAEREAARVSGGRERTRRTNVLSADTPDMSVGTAAHIITLIGDTVNQVRKGELDVSIANSVGYLSGIALKALQRDDVDQRLARLESILDRRRASYEAGSEVEFVNPESRLSGKVDEMSRTCRSKAQNSGDGGQSGARELQQANHDAGRSQERGISGLQTGCLLVHACDRSAYGCTGRVSFWPVANIDR